MCFYRMYDKNPAPVDMSKLLSFGYAEDKKPATNTDLSGESHRVSDRLSYSRPGHHTSFT